MNASVRHHIMQISPIARWRRNRHAQQHLMLPGAFPNSFRIRGLVLNACGKGRRTFILHKGVLQLSAGHSGRAWIFLHFWYSLPITWPPSFIGREIFCTKVSLQLTQSIPTTISEARIVFKKRLLQNVKKM